MSKNGLFYKNPLFKYAWFGAHFRQQNLGSTCISLLQVTVLYIKKYKRLKTIKTWLLFYNKHCIDSIMWSSMLNVTLIVVLSFFFPSSFLLDIGIEWYASSIFFKILQKILLTSYLGYSGQVWPLASKPTITTCRSFDVYLHAENELHLWLLI